MNISHNDKKLIDLIIDNNGISGISANRELARNFDIFKMCAMRIMRPQCVFCAFYSILNLLNTLKNAHFIYKIRIKLQYANFSVCRYN